MTKAHTNTTVMLEYQHKTSEYTHARRYTLTDRVQVPVPLQRCARNVVWRRELFVFNLIILLLIFLLYHSIICTFVPVLLLPLFPSRARVGQDGWKAEKEQHKPKLRTHQTHNNVCEQTKTRSNARKWSVWLAI